jgi:hypothetical protein
MVTYWHASNAAFHQRQESSNQFESVVSLPLSLLLLLLLLLRQLLVTILATYGTKLDFGLTKLRRIASNDNVTHHGQFTAATKSIAVDGSNDRLLALGDAVPGFKLTSGVHVNK